EPDETFYDAPVARDYEALRDRSASLHQRLRYLARGPADLVVDAVLTDKVAHAFSRRHWIFSRESNHLDAATLKLLVKFHELRSFHATWTTPRRPQVNQQNFSRIVCEFNWTTAARFVFS